MLYETPLPAPARTPASLEDYLEALRNRKLLVIATTVLAIVVAVMFTNGREPFYEAKAKILVNPTAEGGSNGSPTAPNLEREVSIALGDAVAAVARTAAAATDPAAATEGSVTASYAPNSDVITIKVISTRAERASQIASAYAGAYVDTRVMGQDNYFSSTIDSIDAELSTIIPRIDDAQSQIVDLDNRLATLGSQAQTTDRDVLLAQLQNQRGTLNAGLQTDLSRKVQLENGKADLIRTRDVQRPAAVVISTAKVPSSPIGLPDWAFWLAGVVGGFLVGAIVAFLLERLDRRAQSTRDVELAVGRPVLGAIPRFGWRFRRGKWALVMANNRKTRSLHSTREGYRRLRSSVRFLAQAERAQVFVITSNQSLEGKSTTAANLAVTMALGGGTVVLVSADLRRPSLEGFFELSTDRGLTEYLEGNVESVRAARFSALPGLAVIPAGKPVPNPGELLTSRRFARLVDRLRRDFDTVIIDTPPLAAAADALAAAARADGVILVIDGRRTETPDLLRIRNELDRSGINLFGAIMNRDRSGRGLLRRSGSRSYYGTKANREAPGLGTELSENRLIDELIIDDEVPEIARPPARTEVRSTGAVDAVGVVSTAEIVAALESLDAALSDDAEPTANRDLSADESGGDESGDESGDGAPTAEVDELISTRSAAAARPRNAARRRRL